MSDLDPRARAAMLRMQTYLAIAATLYVAAKHDHKPFTSFLTEKATLRGGK